MVLGLKPMRKPTTYQYQVLDRTKVLHGPRTQTYGETNYLKNQVLNRTKVLHGPRTQAYEKVSYLRRILSRSVLEPNTRKG